MFSILILTLNEERNLPLCISSALFCDDIVILDSGSTDSTEAIATALGARVYTRPFDNFSNQRNWAHQNVSFKHSWVFHLDADERMTPELFSECIQKSAQSDSNIDGYFVAPKMLWHGIWVPRSTDFPAYQARFVNSERFSFIQSGHGQREDSNMRMGRLASSYEHEMCSEGTTVWLQKHQKYARQEAELYLANKEHHASLAEAIFARNSLKRRRALKHISYILPARSLVRFVYQFFFRMGILDGKAGLEYCLLLSKYEGFAAKEIKKIKKERTSNK